MRAQREPLRTGGQVRIAQRLAGELYVLGDDIGVQFIDAVSGFGGWLQFHLSVGRHLKRAFDSGMKVFDGLDLVQLHDVTARVEAQTAGIEMAGLVLKAAAQPDLFRPRDELAVAHGQACLQRSRRGP